MHRLLFQVGIGNRSSLKAACGSDEHHLRFSALGLVHILQNRQVKPLAACYAPHFLYNSLVSGLLAREYPEASAIDTRPCAASAVRLNGGLAAGNKGVALCLAVRQNPIRTGCVARPRWEEAGSNLQ